MAESEELEGLHEIALRTGEFFLGGANRTITLDDADVAWYVESGSLDIFAIERAHDSQEDSGLKHVFRANAGDLALPFVTTDSALRFVAKGTAGARLHRLAFGVASRSQRYL